MSPLVELRNYTMVPGTRDRFIDLYEREFVDSQEDVGIDLIGTFRHADDPDRFVWLRGFPDSAKRARSLDAFYTSDLWKTHRNAANACIVDSDNVLLLRPAWSGSGFAYRAPPPPLSSPSGGGAAQSAAEGAVRDAAPSGSLRSPPPPRGEEMVVATICYFDAPVSSAFLAGMREAKHDGTIVAAMITEPGPNSYPRLPVREGENVFVWFALFADAKSAHGMSVPTKFQRLLVKQPEVLRLTPTSRSRTY